LDDATYDFLRAQINPSQPPLQRTTAASILARARLNDTELLRLLDTVQVAGPLELPRLLAAFERTTSETVGTKLVAALRAASSLSSLRAEQIKPVFAKYPEAVQQQAAALAASLNADAARQKKRLDELEKALPSGDRDRGRRLFESAQTACSTCHQVGYLGGRDGPDLSRIGSIRTGRDLLEAIVYPSASFVRSYEPMIVTTRSGEEHSGVVREDSSGQITLVTGPGSEVRLARADIRDMRPGSVSIMPQGLDEHLTPEQLADLVAFLKSLK
ncbi:MAG TPA: dehydrogenase, partial [Methylomirabilota bacterium]|nr:dehydrogenase [Methylomirabilota bacterium]